MIGIVDFNKIINCTVKLLSVQSYFGNFGTAACKTFRGFFNFPCDVSFGSASVSAKLKAFFVANSFVVQDYIRFALAAKIILFC